jgi:hypothetical protein
MLIPRSIDELYPDGRPSKSLSFSSSGSGPLILSTHVWAWEWHMKWVSITQIYQTLNKSICSIDGHRRECFLAQSIHCFEDIILSSKPQTETTALEITEGCIE